MKKGICGCAFSGVHTMRLPRTTYKLPGFRKQKNGRFSEKKPRIYDNNNNNKTMNFCQYTLRKSDDELYSSIMRFFVMGKTRVRYGAFYFVVHMAAERRVFTPSDKITRDANSLERTVQGASP